jgi:hypothetical protein
LVVANLADARHVCFVRERGFGERKMTTTGEIIVSVCLFVAIVAALIALFLAGAR